MIVNQFTKSVAEKTKNTLAQGFYRALVGFRKSKPLQILMQVGFGWICFSKIVLNWNHAEIF